ncbi:MAG: aryl-sulfate sulfotransferase [Ignavibacteria bacterium]|nr:aryl-sulfate sulfotransferase [Ignavibacteria bacterium]
MKIWMVLIMALLCGANCMAQTTVGLLDYERGQQEGYVLFAARAHPMTYLIDKCGRAVHSWNTTYKPGQTMYLLPSGSLLRTGNVVSAAFNKEPGCGGIIERYDWDSKVEWSYQLSDATQCQHHDVVPLPNGNILAIVWEKKSVAEAIAAGRDTSLNSSEVWSEKIVEIKPNGASGDIVWEWKLWDHLVQDFDRTKANYGSVADHPELVNINYISNKDKHNPVWIKMNSIAYNAKLDQIVVSAHQFSEFWVIDHSTSSNDEIWIIDNDHNTAHSLATTHVGGKYGKGGDILYRWGNPMAYNQGTKSDRILFEQHSVQWIESGKFAGKIAVFNNGVGRYDGTKFSAIEIVAPAMDKKGNYPIKAGKAFAPAKSLWSYTDIRPASLFFSTNGGGIDFLPNGNIMICTGVGGTMFEITPKKKTIWKYKSPMTAAGPVVQGENIAANDVFRSVFYLPNYQGLKGRKLDTGEPIELNPVPGKCDK